MQVRKQFVLALIAFFALIVPQFPGLAEKRKVVSRLAIVADQNGLAYVAPGDVRRLCSVDCRTHIDLQGVGESTSGTVVPGFIQNYPDFELYLTIGQTFVWVTQAGVPYGGTITFQIHNPCTPSGTPLTQQSPCKVYGPPGIYTYRFESGANARIVVRSSTPTPVRPPAPPPPPHPVDPHPIQK